jgi:hypothetical protein
VHLIIWTNRCWLWVRYSNFVVQNNSCDVPLLLYTYNSNEKDMPTPKHNPDMSFQLQSYTDTNNDQDKSPNLISLFFLTSLLVFFYRYR